MDKKALCELSGAPEMGQIINTTVLAITVIRGTLGLQRVSPPHWRSSNQADHRKQHTGIGLPAIVVVAGHSRGAFGLCWRCGHVGI